MTDRRAVSSLEYTLVVTAIIVGLLSIYWLLKQSESGRFKDASDSFGSGRQYEPYGGHQTTINIQ